jgi:hypothetical protein
MAIKLGPDRIEIGNFILSEKGAGIDFTGVAHAEQFVRKNYFWNSHAVFTAGGYTGGGFSNSIEKFVFATDTTNGVAHSTLTRVRNVNGGGQSPTHGYTVGGNILPPAAISDIEKFPFASTTGSAVTASLTAPSGSTSWSTATFGYKMQNTPAPGQNASIEKFSLITDQPAVVTTATMRSGARAAYGVTDISESYAYTAGFYISTPIDKFAIPSEGSWSPVGALTQGRTGSSMHASTTHGYMAGGYRIPSTTTIDKWPFATDTNATLVGQLTRGTSSGSMQASTQVAGYQSLMTTGTGSIDKFVFSNDTNATSVAQMLNGRQNGSSSQN